MTVPQRSLPVRGNDPEQFREDITALEFFRDLLDPRSVKPLFGAVLAADGITEILPTPPIGYGWLIPQFVCQNPNASGGTATYTMRLGTDGDVVDYRQIAISTPAAVGTHNLNGGLLAETSVTIEVSAGTGIHYCGMAHLVPLTKMRYWRSVALTDTYQTVTLPEIPEGYALRTPFSGWSGSTQSSFHAQWMVNLDGSTRVPLFRLTRDGVAFEFTTSGASARTRTSGGVPPLPLILSGDVLEAKLTTSPGAAVYVGGALELVPLETHA